MKVEKRSVSSSYGASAVSTAYGKPKASASISQNDSIEVSASGSLFQKAVDSLQNVPDIRTEAIEGIQQEMRDGTYHRDETEVADRVLQDHFDSSP